MEQWKHIQGYENSYMVSSYGRVKSLKYGKERIVKIYNDTYGYLQIALSKNNKLQYKKVHRLVALHFIPNSKNKPQVNHINGVKTDNRVENLEWVTAKENVRHAFKIGLKINKKGEKHNKAKLTENQVKEIRKDNRTQKEIAKEYKVHQSLISYVKSGKIWNHI